MQKQATSESTVWEVFFSLHGRTIILLIDKKKKTWRRCRHESPSEPIVYGAQIEDVGLEHYSPSPPILFFSLRPKTHKNLGFRFFFSLEKQWEQQVRQRGNNEIIFTKSSGMKPNKCHNWSPQNAVWWKMPPLMAVEEVISKDLLLYY